MDGSCELVRSSAGTALTKRAVSCAATSTQDHYRAALPQVRLQCPSTGSASAGRNRLSYVITSVSQHNPRVGESFLAGHSVEFVMPGPYNKPGHDGGMHQPNWQRPYNSCRSLMASAGAALFWSLSK